MSETLDWVAALVALDQERLDEEVVNHTLGILLKNHEDIESMRGGAGCRARHRARDVADRRDRDASCREPGAVREGAAGAGRVRARWRHAATRCARWNMSDSSAGTTCATRCGRCWSAATTICARFDRVFDRFWRVWPAAGGRVCRSRFSRRAAG